MFATRRILLGKCAKFLAKNHARPTIKRVPSSSREQGEHANGWEIRKSIGANIGNWHSIVLYSVDSANKRWR
jgi:hypothetical protein